MAAGNPQQDRAAGRRGRRASTTAITVTVIRAEHLLWHQPPIFADTFALELMPGFWRPFARNRLLNRIVLHGLMRLFRPVHTEVILRARFAEDRLREAVAGGIGQYVILGAGLDTFSLRRGDLAVRIFEVDQPASQRMKRRRLVDVNGSVPANLVLVPVDFERDRLDDELRRAGFDSRRPAFFSWLGTTYYLTRDAIRETLGHVAALAAPGSRIVLDYKYPRELVPEGSLRFADRLDRFVALLGEPFLSAFTPEEMNAELARAGFDEMDSVPPGEQAKRYLEGRTDMPDPAPNLAFALYAAKRTRTP